MAKRGSLTIIFLLLLVLSSFGQAQNPQVAFDDANQLLQNGHIRQAINGYKKLERENHISAALYLNLGLSYVQLDSMGRAKYYFLKSQQFEETKTKAEQGLQYVETQFSRQSAVLPTLPWQQAIQWLNNAIGATLLLIIGILLLNIGAFAFLYLWYADRKIRFLRGSTMTVAGLGVIIILLSFFIDYRQQRYHRAVMVHQQTAVRNHPAGDAELVSQAFEGYTFRLDQTKSSRQNGWSYVRMSNGQYGWIHTKEIMIL